MSLMNNLIVIAIVACGFAFGLPKVYPQVKKAPVDTSWTKEDSDYMRVSNPPIRPEELGKHGRTSPLTLGNQLDNN